VRRQVPIPIKYKNLEFDEGFRADLIVENMVLVELKASETNHAVYYRQLASYLKLSDPAEPAEPAEPADPAVPFTTSACGTNQKGKTSPGCAVLATNLV
jgi:PD-(D/E)XK nuclease superfamily